jgi:hypothetical protein
MKWDIVRHDYPNTEYSCMAVELKVSKDLTICVEEQKEGYRIPGCRKHYVVLQEAQEEAIKRAVRRLKSEINIRLSAIESLTGYRHDEREHMEALLMLDSDKEFLLRSEVVNEMSESLKGFTSSASESIKRSKELWEKEYGNKQQ